MPSGNLGNLTAGVIAQRLGLPVREFVAASNVNDVLPAYLSSGSYAAKPAVQTISNAMDVGDPSNFPRLAQLHAEALGRLRANLVGWSVTDDETRRVIRSVYRGPATCWTRTRPWAWRRRSHARRELGERRPIVTLATAHPAKFGDVIQQELGFVPPLPDAWRDWESRPLCAQDLADVDYETFRRPE